MLVLIFRTHTHFQYWDWTFVLWIETTTVPCFHKQTFWWGFFLEARFPHNNRSSTFDCLSSFWVGYFSTNWFFEQATFLFFELWALVFPLGFSTTLSLLSCTMDTYFPNESIINNSTYRNVQCQFFNALNPEGSCLKGDTCKYVHLSKRQFRRERGRHPCLQAAIGTGETYSDLEPQEQPPTEREGDAQPLKEQTPAVSPVKATQPFLENIIISGQLYSQLLLPILASKQWAPCQVSLELLCPIILHTMQATTLASHQLPHWEETLWSGQEFGKERVGRWRKEGKGRKGKKKKEKSQE